MMGLRSGPRGVTRLAPYHDGYMTPLKPLPMFIVWRVLLLDFTREQGMISGNNRMLSLAHSFWGNIRIHVSGNLGIGR